MSQDQLARHDAETIVERPDIDGGPVDVPHQRRTAYVTVTSRANHDRRPIVPAWMRSGDQRGQFAGDAVSLAVHMFLYHLTRTPKYAVKLGWYAPVGLFRIVGKQLAWWWVIEQNLLRQEAATNNDPLVWHKLHVEGKRTRAKRGYALLFELIVLVVAIVLIMASHNKWIQYGSATTALLVLARVGRPIEKPLIDRITIGQEFIKLTAPMTRVALMSCGLSIKDPESIKFVRDIYRDPPGWTALVNLPPGMIATDVIEKRDRLAAGFRLPKMQVWPATVDGEHPGQVRIWVADKPVNAMKQPPWPLLSGGKVDYFKPFPYGFDERLRPVSWRLDEKNSLFGGIPGSGKSLAVRVILLGAILDPLVIPVSFDLKGTGDFDAVEPLCPPGLFGSGADEQTKLDAYQAIMWLYRQCDERGPIVKEWARKLGTENKVTREMAKKEPRLRPIVANFDEVQELFTDKEHGKAAVAAMTSVIKRGRALGIHVILATQRIDKESIPRGISSNMGIRLALACTAYTEVDLILGNGSYSRGARSTEFEPGPDSGWGYRAGLGRLQPVRAAYVDNAGAAAVVRRAIAARKAEGYEPAPRIRVRSIVEDVRAVWPPDVTGWWLADILAALKALDDTYAEMDTDTLSAALRAAGLKVEQVHRKIDRQGVTRQGLQLASMPKPQQIELED